MLLNRLWKKMSFCLILEQILINAFHVRTKWMCLLSCMWFSSASVCACIKLLFLFPSVKTSLHELNSRTTYPTNTHVRPPLCLPRAPPRLPSILLRPPSKKTCMLKLQCVWRHCGKAFPPAHPLHLPCLSLLIFFLFCYCFGWVSGGGLFRSSLNCENSCPCSFASTVAVIKVQTEVNKVVM